MQKVTRTEVTTHTEHNRDGSTTVTTTTRTIVEYRAKEDAPQPEKDPRQPPPRRYSPIELEQLQPLLDKNRAWAHMFRARNPGMLEELSKHQNPEICWIGCSDSRVPADLVCGLEPGSVFVHRNIANVVNHSDFSCLSVLQYAVEVLKVKHIIVCGHYGCGGCSAAMSHKQYGMIDNWLRSIKDVYAANKRKILSLHPAQQLDALVELNTAQSVWHVAETSVVQNAWARGQELTVHGWVYQLEDGLIHDLKLSVSAKDEIDEVYAYATEASVQSLERRRSHFEALPIMPTIQEH
ncbi:carbonic anhydrase [Chytriomyces sp. MP71]|nr:carbonic anhydrase [Chytriomyces sp. MP71]